MSEDPLVLLRLGSVLDRARNLVLEIFGEAGVLSQQLDSSWAVEEAEFIVRDGTDLEVAGFVPCGSRDGGED